MTEALDWNQEQRIQPDQQEKLFTVEPDAFKAWWRMQHSSSAYIQNWLSVLKNDVKFIVSASSKAEKAVEYILGEAWLKSEYNRKK